MEAKGAANCDEFPLSVKKAGITVKIYRIEGASGYLSYQISDYSKGARQLRSFSDLGKAKREAKRIAGALARGDAAAASLRGSDAAAFARAEELLKPTGVPIEIAAATFADAYKALAGNRIIEAAKYYARRYPTIMPRKCVTEAIDEFLDTKRRDGAKERYLQDLTYRLGKLRNVFNGSLTAVTGDRLDSWLRKSKLSAQSRVNFSRVFSVFFQFCVSRSWLPKDWDELDRVARPKVRRGEIAIYSKLEIAKLLAAATAEFVPVLAVAAFAGIRSAEIERLDWREIDLTNRHIKVTAGKAKTASRRIIPVTDNLDAWLKPYVRKQGPFWPFARDEMYDAQQVTAEKSGVSWKRNACRHSFISYRLALVEDAAKVALEAGNSPEMIFQHYRELVTPGEAKVWFAITPADGDVIAFKKAATNSTSGTSRSSL